ncbi:MAG: NAD(P)H-dependent oxidoreductase [Rhizobiaceae bacterium]
MTKILRIDSSSRPEAASPTAEGSYSRRLATMVTSHLTGAGHSISIVKRDLVEDPMSHISIQTIAGYYTPEEQRSPELKDATALSDKLIAEINEADILVLSVPIYNFSIPSCLKAWIDQIVRINESFAYEDGNFRGLVSGKKAYVCFSYGAGGYLNDGPLAGYDYMAPYIAMILNFIGIEDVTTFAIEATTADADTIATQMATTTASINQHFAT